MDKLEEAEARKASEKQKETLLLRLPTPVSTKNSSEFLLVNQVLPDFLDSSF